MTPSYCTGKRHPRIGFGIRCLLHAGGAKRRLRWQVLQPGDLVAQQLVVEFRPGILRAKGGVFFAKLGCCRLRASPAGPLPTATVPADPSPIRAKHSARASACSGEGSRFFMTESNHDLLPPENPQANTYRSKCRVMHTSMPAHPNAATDFAPGTASGTWGRFGGCGFSLRISIEGISEK
jgi:hypothetical protein